MWLNYVFFLFVFFLLSFFFFFLNYFDFFFLWRQFRGGAMIGENINMDVTLPFWVITRSGRRNVMNHIASRGTIFGRRVAGNVFSMSHTATSSWPYMDFKCLVTSVPGGGVMPLYGKWAGLPIYGSLHPSTSFWGP